MVKKFSNLGVQLSRLDSKKIFGGEAKCESYCLTHNDCPVDRVCETRVCDADKTTNYKACFRQTELEY